MQIGPEGPGPAQTYWQADLRPGPRLSFAEAAAQLRTKLEESVKLRLMSDVPLGTFLSGGVDSSAVTALTGQLTGAPVQAFTVGFDFPDGSHGDQKFNSDLHHARQAAAHFACQHHQIILRHDGALAELLPQLIYAMDEPVADSAIFQTLFVAALARHQGVPVLLSGDGADEILGGYPFFAAAQNVQRYQQVPGRALLDRLIGYLPPGGRWEGLHKLRQKAGLRERGEHFLSWEANFRAPQIRAMLSDAQMAEVGLAQLDQTLGALLAPVDSPHLADYVAYAKLRLWLAEDNNMRYDKISMWMSIEARAPFEDQELVNFALGLPLAYKLQGGGKGVLKKALADLLPASILQRPKWGFNPPLSDWLRGPLRPWVDRYLSAEALRANGFQAEPLRAMIEAHLERRAYHLSEIWNLLVLQLWAALYIHQDLAIPARWSAGEVYTLQEEGRK
jgi:asparagine synthase (glutamine-hydrolysing)